MARRSQSAIRKVGRNLNSKLPRQAVARYRNIQLIARGGMGEVFRATDSVLGRQVAIKAIRPESAADRKRQIRLRREIMAMAQVNHPNMVHLYDFCEDESSACYVMEYVAGQTLDCLLDEEVIRPTTAVALAAQVADALVNLHQKRILHRDITPSNIMVSIDGTAKLMDFGLVKISCGEELTELTEKDCLIGTLLYLPPEYLRFQPWTEKSDVYQLGAVLYKAITGRVPVPADKILSLRQGSADVKIAPPSAVLAKAYSALDEIVMKALSCDPKQRYSSAAELRDNCLAWLVSLDTKPMEVLSPSDDTMTKASLLLSSSNLNDSEPKTEKTKTSSQKNSSRKKTRRSRRKVPTLVRMQLARHQEEKERLSRWRAVLSTMAILFVLAVTAVKIVTWIPSAAPAIAVRAMPVKNISRSALHKAVAVGKLKTTRKLLSSGVDLHGLDNNGWTPLHIAVLANKRDIADLLIEKGTHVEVTDERGYTPLHWASFLGRVELVELLLNKGANPNFGWGRCTAIHIALNSNVKEMRRVLKENWPPKTSAAHTSDRKKITKILLNNGADCNSRDRNEQTALHLASAEGFNDIVLAILHRGVNNIDTCDNEGETPLHKAVRCKGATTLVQTLLGAGAKVELRNSKGQRAYDLAKMAKKATVSAMLKAAKQ